MHSPSSHSAGWQQKDSWQQMLTPLMMPQQQAQTVTAAAAATTLSHLSLQGRVPSVMLGWILWEVLLLLVLWQVSSLVSLLLLVPPNSPLSTLLS
jgi:hypothetical protein